MKSIYGDCVLSAGSPIKGESQKRAVVLHKGRKMMVAKGFSNSGLMPFLNKDLLCKTGQRNKVWHSRV